MGFLTTILFSNDAYDTIKDNPTRVVENILDAMQNHKAKSYGVGNHCNPMKAMGTSHMDINRLFVQWGNSLFEIGTKDGLSLENRKAVLKIVKNIIKDEEQYIKYIEDNTP